MSGDDYARLAWAALLGAVLVGWLVTQSRGSRGKLAQMAVGWVLIFAGVIAVYALWDDIGNELFLKQDAISAPQRIEIPRSRDGHYYVTAMVNGAPVDFVVDTGATQVVLTDDDARRAGIDPDQLVYSGWATTANGRVRTAPIQLDQVTIGPNIDRRVPAVINDGDLAGSLLGMSYLDRWSKIEIADGAMVLSR
ncbi:retropepsin-like aspartic protease family protein [Chachezhania sediminis]|uniref:retropepsin-like aspartic protease family protein n=1 Tax=Chachezhania sediminis TaxID=2599291 RepID=UPI00131D4AEC|nr:TIGR02281 family clan AA aspartic protease [Chachezhania sediminis]